MGIDASRPASNFPETASWKTVGPLRITWYILDFVGVSKISLSECLPITGESFRQVSLRRVK